MQSFHYLQLALYKASLVLLVAAWLFSFFVQMRAIAKAVCDFQANPSLAEECEPTSVEKNVSLADMRVHQ